MRIRVVALAADAESAVVESGYPLASPSALWTSLREGLMDRKTLTGVYVFVCAHFNNSDELGAHSPWVDAVRQANENAWGAPVVAVLSGLVVDHETLLSHNGIWEEHLRQALAAGATHILADEGIGESLTDVRWLDRQREHLKHVERVYAGNWSLDAWQVALPLSTDLPWTFRGAENAFRRFLGAHITDSPGRGRESLLVVLGDRPAQAQVDALRKVRAAVRPMATRQMVAVTYRTDPTPALQEYCHGKNLPTPVRTGALELRALVMRLNRGVAFNRGLLPETDTLPPDVSPVTTRPPLVFRAIHRPPCVLLTSGFQVETDRVLVSDSCQDIAHMVRAIPPQVRYHVDHALTPERLPDAIARCAGAPPALSLGADPEPDGPHVWIHAGHGSADGLAADRVLAPTRRWLDCFGAGRVRLSLALFLSCHSAALAHAFAEAGVSVAVGFEGPTWTPGCREFAVRLLDKALAGGLNRDAILEAFRQGAPEFRGIQGKVAQPRAFFAHP